MPIKTIIILLSCFAIQLGFSQCNSRYLADSFSVMPVMTKEFGVNEKYDGTIQKLKMDIYLPQGDVNTKRPCLVFCFGGSFVAGDRKSPELVYLATEFAKKGYVCASIDYRLDMNFNLLVEESMLKAVVRAIQDGRAALRYLNMMRDSFGIDTNQIFIGGTSAGGVLALNLAFMDENDNIKSDWLKWANEIGGLEGNSGNPGYSSKVRGVFSFAGGLGDTSYLNEKDLPIYMCHSTNDATVLNGYGKPLSGFAPVALYGSKTIKQATDRMGIYSVYDEYVSAEHPPFVSSASILDTTKVHLTQFLYNNLMCNPNRVYSPNPQPKTKQLTSSLNIVNQNIQIYPNPVEDRLFVNTSVKFVSIKLYDALGNQFEIEEISDHHYSMLKLHKGLYFLEINDGNSIYITNFVKN